MSTSGLARIAMGAAAASLSVVLLAACASSHAKTTVGAGGATTGGGSSASTSSLKTESTSIGTVAADASGHTLYELVGDSASNPMCTGGCLAIWPAVMVNGTQVVLQGHPAFTYSADTAAGQVHGQGVKDQWGTWWALDSNGKPITSAAPAGGASSSTSGGGGGGGYGY